MNYKSIEKKNKVYFKYLSFKNENYKNDNKTTNENSPFNVLKNLVSNNV